MKVTDEQAIVLRKIMQRTRIASMIKDLSRSQIEAFYDVDQRIKQYVDSLDCEILPRAICSICGRKVPINLTGFRCNGKCGETNRCCCGTFVQE